MVVWVQNDRVRLHHAGGRLELSEGDILFLRAAEPHALQGRGEAPMVVSVALCSEVLDRLGTRHPDLAGRMFWSDAPAPQTAHLDSRALASLNQTAMRLERAAETALEAEAFLLPLCAQLIDREVSLPDGAPSWLALALTAAKDPKVFREGAAGFARIAGRAHPHVSRTMRRFTGQTPSDYINSQRMAFAARRLAGSSDPLSEIAADCGIPESQPLPQAVPQPSRADPGAVPPPLPARPGAPGRMRLRRAEPAEAGAVRDLVRRAYAHYVPRIGREPGPMTDDYAGQIAAGQVLVPETSPIEAVLVLVDAADHLLLHNVAVAPEARGRGLGRALVAAAEAEAMARGHRLIRLYTHEKMTENRALYARLGYRETHSAVEHGLARVFFEKSLPASPASRN